MKRIPLSRGLFVLVDDADFDELSKHRWHAGPVLSRRGGFYAQRGRRRGEKGPTTIYMHRHILGAGPGQEVDHVNHDGLDNRRENLRLCTRSQNNANTRWKRGVSSYRGVYRNRKHWRAIIWIKRQRHILGYFSCPVEAARAYDKAAVEVYGEFATLNFPENLWSAA